jgi:hypothetical protein
VADIFQEVDEDLRRDKAAEWWKRNSLYIYAVALVVIVGTAGYQGWRSYDEKLRGQQSDSYAAAVQLIEDGEEARAREALSALSDPSGKGYQLLSVLAEAYLAAKNGDEATARQLWQQLADEQASVQPLTELGALYAAMRDIDEGDPAALRGELRPLSVSGAPYRFLALELLAAVELREGDNAAARDLLQQITDDPLAPAGSRSRAAELLASLPG